MAFTLDIGFKSAPIMSRLGNIADSIYLPRGGDDASREAAIQKIVDR